MCLSNKKGDTMATPISEVIAQNTEVLESVKAVLTKAEETPPATPKEEETKEGEGEEDTTEEEKDITREEFDALLARVEELEEKLTEKEEQNAKLTEAVEASTEALNRVNAYFGVPHNRAQLAKGEAIRQKAEAVDPAPQKNSYETWASMPYGKEREAFFKAHESEIVECLK
jgi:small-conductance mechanosensitive channel